MGPRRIRATTGTREGILVRFQRRAVLMHLGLYVKLPTREEQPAPHNQYVPPTFRLFSPDFLFTLSFPWDTAVRVPVAAVPYRAPLPLTFSCR